MIGRARPERVFSVGHTGGDLSLPDKVRAQVMPSPFPVMDAHLRGSRSPSGSEADGDPSPRAGSGGRPGETARPGS